MLADITNNVNIGCQAASAPPSWSTGSFGPLSQLQKKYRLLAQLLSRLSRCPDQSGLPEAGECTNAQALSRTYHRTASDVIHLRPWPNCSSRSRQAEPGHKTMWMPLSICWSSLRGRPIFCSGKPDQQGGLRQFAALCQAGLQPVIAATLRVRTFRTGPPARKGSKYM